eukprot:gnl/MRDRNA2_/MRDRNA2_147961_c0_seq1.p1 gnl/MRDRNA2_/MRDRNA2_147961_c0~~gnl/MRDRNA2_/MRDRNA2_147961_c0_seq1.p1  ORF type:complete len:257 (+),score=47.70 gnl/MRDRNA2_/MRDRNA2_147961_c0_seq1:68-838(+)
MPILSPLLLLQLLQPCPAPPDFGNAEYWEKRYQRQNGTYEWYQGWAGLKDKLLPYVHKNSQILMIGAGNSKLSEDMFLDGFQNVWSLDISEVAMENMRKRTAAIGMPEERWLAMDARNLSSFKDGSFDITLEKGTMDALLSSEDYESNLGAMLDEISRVLVPGGAHVTISSCLPDICLEYLEGRGQSRRPWSVTIEKVHKSWVKADQRKEPPKDLRADFIYVCSKPKDPSGPSSPPAQVRPSPPPSQVRHPPRAEV